MQQQNIFKSGIILNGNVFIQSNAVVYLSFWNPLCVLPQRPLAVSGRSRGGARAAY